MQHLAYKSDFSFHPRYNLGRPINGFSKQYMMMWHSLVEGTKGMKPNGIPELQPLHQSDRRVEGCSRVVMDGLSAFVRPMILSDLDHTMVDHDDVENVSLLCMLHISCPDGNKKSLGPSAVTVYPTGVERTLHERIHELKGWYGDKQEKCLGFGWIVYYLHRMVQEHGW